MRKTYDQPEIRTMSASEVLESLGPATAYTGSTGTYSGSGTVLPPNSNPWGEPGPLG